MIEGQDFFQKVTSLDYFPSDIAFKSIVLLIFLYILGSLIIDLFVCGNRISLHLYRNFPSGVIKFFVWIVSKPEIRICFLHRFVESRVEGTG